MRIEIDNYVVGCLMSSFSFSFPTTVYSGKGSLARLAQCVEEEKVKNILLVTDSGILNSDFFHQVVSILESSGIYVSIFSGVEPNPNTKVLERALQLLISDGCDAVLGVGGGSSLDVAKAVAAMASNPGSILDYEGVGKIENPALPLFAVPTTAGTGSECTPATVITDSERGFKVSVISNHLFPRVAFLDPELVVGLPPAITAATGMDALTHGIESYVSKQANPISKGMAYHSIKMISNSLLVSFKDGNNLDAREEMLVASLMSGVAFSQSRLGNVHAISHTFGGLFNIPHGLANAVLLPYVMSFNLEACAELYKDVAVAMGRDVSGLSKLDAGRVAIEEVVALNFSLGIPATTKEIGVDLDYLEDMVSDAMKSGNVLVNPKDTCADDIRRIILDSHSGVLL